MQQDSLVRTTAAGSSGPGSLGAAALCLVNVYIQQGSWEIPFGWPDQCSTNSLFYLSARSPMCIRCARTSLAGQIHSFLSYLRSLASRPFLHRVSQAQRLVWATNHQQLASGEPGSAEIRQPIRPIVFYEEEVAGCTHT